MKKSKKYDLYFYYSAYSRRYGDHLINLSEYIPKENLEKFDESILKNTCSSNNNEIVGLVIYIYKFYLIYIISFYYITWFLSFFN